MGGNDKLIGSRKDDILDGGEGDDVLTGKKGADTYVLSSGKDKFKRFKLEEGDTIEIDSDIAYTLVQSNKNTLIQHDDGMTTVLKVNKDKLADVIDMI
jgi:Ca2+-binding RTX toxin-like protein